jgi:hypothetical protein
VIFAEHAEHGYLGAPIAKHVIETYFAKLEGKPLPVFASPGPPPTPPIPEEPPAVPDADPPVASAPTAAPGAPARGATAER